MILPVIVPFDTLSTAAFSMKNQSQGTIYIVSLDCVTIAKAPNFAESLRFEKYRVRPE
jgi:hypothetical protein